MSDKESKSQGAVQTTGHAWDGDLQEYNNPLPTWWLWAFYGTVVFALIYWVLYPAWPIAGTYTKGILNHISYVDAQGHKHSTHWNTRALLLRDVEQDKAAQTRREFLAKIEKTPYPVIFEDAEMMQFIRSQAKGLFGDNCAACHGTGGTGVIGLFPNLADDDWLWGGKVEDIETTIRDGRTGFMPAFKEALTDAQIDDVAGFVLSLSGHTIDADKVTRGRKVFQTQIGGCYYCHTPAGTGLKSQGSANLTDAIWSVADVLDAPTPAAQLEAVRNIIRNGVHRQMPSWRSRLSPAQIKLLTVYVHELGGGQ